MCGGCGNPLDECRDPKTARTWQVIDETCQACLVGEAAAGNRAELERQTKRPQRGVYQAVVRR